MSKPYFDEYSIRKYILTIFFSFVTVFVFLMLMMQWKGDFVPKGKGTEHVKVTEDSHHD